jgi:RimJ/RimL family protein N-acetyltransferase
MPTVRSATDEDLRLVAAWLVEPEVAMWLDFGAGRSMDVRALKYTMARGTDCLFTYSVENTPIGVVGLCNIHARFRTAMLWYALGERRFGRRGLTTRAVADVLGKGFQELGLAAINAWTVVGNEASVRILEKNGFRLIGRQRQCHHIDGEPRDRLLFDLLECEFRERVDA